MPEFWIVVAALCIGAFYWLARRSTLKREEEERRRKEEELRQRRENLIAKFGSEEIADAIIAQKIWQGMSSEQLLESWGWPADKDTKVFKQKTSETWKYNQIGKNRFSRRVFLENGAVVGWEQK